MPVVIVGVVHDNASKQATRKRVFDFLLHRSLREFGHVEKQQDASHLPSCGCRPMLIDESEGHERGRIGDIRGDKMCKFRWKPGHLEYLLR